MYRDTLLRKAVIESLEIRTLLSAVYLYGDAGPTAWDIRRVGDNVQIFQNQPLTASPLMTIPAADNDPIWIYGESGHDTVTVDYSGGDPVAGGLFFEEFSTINNGCTLVVTNTGGAQFTLNRNLLTVAGSDFSDNINFPSNRKPNLSLFGGGGSDQLDVVQGSYTFNSDLGAGGASVDMVVGSSAGNTASVLFGVTQHLDSLAIDSGGSVQMRPAGGQVLDTNTLSVNGTLDLSDNDLIVNNPSSSDMTTLQEDVVAGNPVTSGVTTTPEPGSIYASDGPSDGMTLGVAPAADLLTPLTVLDGQAVPSTALVARYTVPGDANLDGVVDGSDLEIVLFNFDRSPGVSPPAWYKGDFNYDGTINSSDLFDLLAYFGSSVANATPTTVTAGQTYTLALPAQASGTSAPVTQWDVNWGDGQVDSLTPADATATSTDFGTLYSTTHVYTNTGPVLIQVTEIIQSGNVFHAVSTPLAITAASGLATTAYTLAAQSTDAINIAGDGLGNTVVRDNGSIVQIIPAPYLLSLNITGDTDGTTTVDFSDGDPLAPSGLSTDSSLVDITGSSGSDTLFTTSTAAVFGNAEIRYPSSTALTFLNAGPGDTIAAVAGTVTIAGDMSNNGAGSANGGPTVVVNTGATVLFTGTQHLSALDILPGGTARMVQYGSYQLVTNSLNIAPYQGPPGDLPASVDATLGGSDPGEVSMLWDQGPVVDGYGSCLAGPSGLSEVIAGLSPVSSGNYEDPAAIGFPCTGFDPGQWVLCVNDWDPLNSWGGDHVAIEQGYNLVAGILTPVGSCVAIDLTTHSIVTGTESITTFGYIAVGPNGYASGGLLDLSDNDLIVHNGNLNTIAGLLANGYDSGSWDAYSFGSDPEPAAIDSTTALNDAAYLETLGYAQIGTAAGDLNLSTFDAQPVSTGDVIVKFTYYGDANLDGNVNSADQSMMTTGLSGWTNGDFNYDGTVDGSDYSLVDAMTDTLVGQNQNVPSGTTTLAADANFPVSSLPTTTPTGEAISSWEGDFGNGDVQTFLPTDTVANPYPDATASYIATLIPLDANGNPEYYYPHMTINVTYVTPPAAPTSLSATPESSSEIDLSWTGSPSATSYEIYLSTDGTNYGDFGSSTTTSYTATGLGSGTTYHFKVEAFDNTVASALSTAASAATTGTAETQVLTATTVSPNEIDLSWSGIDSLASEYDLSEYISGAWVPLDTVDTTQTTYDVTGLSSGTAYDFEVTASGYGIGLATVIASATTATPPVVTATGSTSIAEGGTYTLILAADSSAGGSDTVAGWNVDWGDGTPVYYAGSDLTLNYLVPTGWTGLAIVATAQTVAGTVPSYSVQADPIYVDVVPIAPTLISAVVNSESDITITWDDTGECDSSIVLLRSDAGGTYNPIMTFDPGDGSFDDTGLSPSTSYSYELETVGGLDGLAISMVSTGSLTTQSSDLGFNVSAGSFDANSGTINTSWTYAGSDVSSWELEDEDTSITGSNYDLIQTPSPGTQSYPIGNVTTGDTYNIRLRADYTDGQVSSWDMKTMTLSPSLIPTVTATPTSDDGGNHAISIAWALPSGVSSANYSNVSIEYKGSSTAGTGWVMLDGGDGYDGFDYDYSPVIFNIGDGQQATFRVMVDGLNQGGWGYSNGNSPVQQDGTPGPSPAISWNVNSDGTIGATWATAPVPGVQYLLFYADQHYAQAAQGSGLSGGSADPYFGSYCLNDSFVVQPGDHLSVGVEEQSTDSYGNTTYGFTIANYNVSGAPLPNSPSGLVATLTDPTHVFLHWFDNSYDETGFQIYRSDDSTFQTDVSLITTTGADVNQYADTLPDELTTYYYRVYAFSTVAATSDIVLASDQIVLGDSTGHADGSQGGLALKSVQFDGYSVEVGASGGNQDFQSISLDSGKGIYPTDQPEWLDTTLNGQIGTSTFLDGTIAPLDPDGAVDIAAPHSWPISYERSLPDETAYMLAKPVFAFKGIVTGVWEVQGNSTFGSSDAVTLGPADLTQGDGTLSATVTSDQPIPDTIESQSLTITWRVSFDGGKTWIVAPVGVSANHLFVTGGSAPSAYETVLWLGSNGEPTGLRPHNPDEDNLVSHSWPNGEANGMDIAVADAIFTNFSGLDTKRVDRTEMVYVPSQIGSTASVPLSRADGHGQCSSWADLLFDTLTAQGVAASKLLILPANPYNKFKVRNADVQGGIALAPPSTQFNFHVVVMISADPDRIYDASFGVTTDSGDAGTVELQWEEDHVIDFGFPALAGFSPTGAAIFVEQWLGLNPAGQQLRWSPWPF